jgi:hypothetical protein
VNPEALWRVRVTSVKTRDVASVLWLHEKNYAAAIGNAVKREMRAQGRTFFAAE